MEYASSLFIISGTSRGLGKALAEQLLEKGANVFGISRSQSIEHPSYTHINLDLSSIEELKNLHFPDFSPYSSLALINNAGTLGEVSHFNDLSEDDIISTTHLNFLAPLLLCKRFFEHKSNGSAVKYVLNIGTGAATSPIDGWSLYCSTKAGLLMFTKVIHEELKIKNGNCKILDLAPGIIDTDMQQNIRNTDPQNFSNVERFRDYYRNGDLQSAEQTAAVLIRNFEMLFDKDQPTDSIRNYL